MDVKDTKCVSENVRANVIRGQWGMKESEYHQRHGFPPVHLSTQNKQASHLPGSSSYVLASEFSILPIYLYAHTETVTHTWKHATAQSEASSLPYDTCAQ